MRLLGTANVVFFAAMLLVALVIASFLYVTPSGQQSTEKLSPITASTKPKTERKATSVVTPEPHTDRTGVQKSVTGRLSDLDSNSTVTALLEAFRGRFRTNPQETLDDLAHRLSDTSKLETLEMAFFSDWAATDPLSAITAARNCRFRSGDLSHVSPVRIALNQWASQSPDQAAEWLVNAPWYAELAEDHRKSVEAIFVAWGRKAPERGLDWLAKHQGQLGQSSSSAITSLSLSAAVYGKDYAAARDIAQLHPAPDKRAELLKRISELAGNR